MKNMIIYASPDVEEKILYKHRVELDELKDALKYGKPKFIKQEGKIYMALTHHLRYITMIFEYNKPFANVITAYSSSEPQIRKYNKK